MISIRERRCIQEIAVGRGGDRGAGVRAVHFKLHAGDCYVVARARSDGHSSGECGVRGWRTDGNRWRRSIRSSRRERHVAAARASAARRRTNPEVILRRFAQASEGHLVACHHGVVNGRRVAVRTSRTIVDCGTGSYVCGPINLETGGRSGGCLHVCDTQRC